jgi:oxygen-independent coproporphyrinogen-3 oxidase
VASLYVHVPFRERPRSYDDAFYVRPNDASASSSEYVSAVCRELRFYAHQYAADDGIETIYAGGGRPSLLRLGEVQSVVNTVLDLFDTSAITEATAEVNPADATREYLRGLNALGFNRLSLPVLSFYPDDLAALGTPHSSADAIRAVRLAHHAGFEHLSIDLLFGRPGGSFERWKANLQQAVDLRIPHLAIAEWTGDDPTEDAAVQSNGDDQREVETAKSLSFAISYLERNGYTQYELTHFARDGHRSRHHDATYAHANQLGVGPSAHSLWWSRDTEKAPARRWANVRDLDRYVDLLGRRYPPVAFRQTLPWPTLAQEYVMLRLRTGEGLDLGRLRRTYGLDLLERRGDLLHTLAEKGLVEHADAPVPASESGTERAEEAGPRIRLTPRGRLVTDGITQRLLAGLGS